MTEYLQGPLYLNINLPKLEKVVAWKLFGEIRKRAEHMRPTNFIIFSVNKRRAALMRKWLWKMMRSMGPECTLIRDSTEQGLLCLKFECMLVPFEVRFILKPDVISTLDNAFVRKSIVVWLGTNLIREDFLKTVHRYEILRNCPCFEIHLGQTDVTKEVEDLCRKVEDISLRNDDDESDEQ